MRHFSSIELESQMEKALRVCAESFIEKVNEGEYPVIEMNEKLVRHMMADRDKREGDDYFDRSDVDFDEIVGKKFVIRFTSLFGETIEYILVGLEEENDRLVLNRFAVISRHALDDRKSVNINAPMKFLFTAYPSMDVDDPNYIHIDVQNTFYGFLEENELEIPDDFEEFYRSCAAYWCAKTVLALSIITEKNRSRRKVVNYSPNGKIANIPLNGAVINSVGSSVIKIGDDITVYANGFKGDKTYTRHIESWAVRGHLRHYKSGKVAYIKPFIKGDRSVPVQNKVYQVV